MYTLCLSAQVGECSRNRKENRRGVRGHVVEGLHIPTWLSDSSYFYKCQSCSFIPVLKHVQTQTHDVTPLAATLLSLKKLFHDWGVNSDYAKHQP